MASQPGDQRHERAGQQQQQAAGPVTKEMLQAAEQLIGIELTDAHEAMALPGVNRNRAAYDARVARSVVAGSTRP